LMWLPSCIIVTFTTRFFFSIALRFAPGTLQSAFNE
jgi:hypothetical protein